MEVEIKLRLPNKEAHDKVAEALKDAYIETHDQENFFYEGSEKELNKARVSLRTRFYGGDKKCVITMKGRQSMVGGVGTATEVEEDVDPAEARKWLTNPDALLNLQGSDILEKLRRDLKPKHLVCLGGFKNMRQDYNYEGLKMELDETSYEWGTCYEIEIETEDPEPTKAKLEAFLESKGIPYKYGTKTKFANFRQRTLE
ncbi:hypothetical protein ABBQ38_015404 [Trebouxia sp. C0009 RCD-2024]